MEGSRGMARGRMAEGGGDHGGGNRQEEGEEA